MLRGYWEATILACPPSRRTGIRVTGGVLALAIQRRQSLAKPPHWHPSHCGGVLALAIWRRQSPPVRQAATLASLWRSPGAGSAAAGPTLSAPNG